MAGILDARIILSETVCINCRKESNVHSIDSGNLNLIYDMKDVRSADKIPQSLFTVKVDIKRIRIHRKENGEYSARALIEVRCPKCSQIHNLDDVMEVPRIVFEDIKKCDFCGREMRYLPEEIEIEDKHGVPLVTSSGLLRCDNCQNTTVFASTNDTITDNLEKREWYITSGHSRPITI